MDKIDKIKEDKQAYKDYINYIHLKNIYGFNGYKVLMRHYGSELYIGWTHLEATKTLASLENKRNFSTKYPQTIAETILETRNIKHKIETLFSFRYISKNFIYGNIL